ncbi:MAG: LPXTG cell wall anchor domain-containing protein [Marmoricola sp.]
MRNLVNRGVLVLLVVLGALAGTISTASAAGEIGLSTDGVHWSSTLPGPLFDPTFRWVPGDVETATFYVRNQDPDAALLDVTMLTGPVETLIASGDLTVGARVDGGAFTDATTAGSHLLVDQVPVASGAVRKVDVRVSFDPASTNETQDLRLDLNFRVQLSQDSSVSTPGDGGTGSGSNPGNGNGSGSGNGSGGTGSSGSGNLPDTGSSFSPMLLAEAVLLVAAGFLLVGFSRRRRQEVGR